MPDRRAIRGHGHGRGSRFGFVAHDETVAAKTGSECLNLVIAADVPLRRDQGSGKITVSETLTGAEKCLSPCCSQPDDVRSRSGMRGTGNRDRSARADRLDPLPETLVFEPGFVRTEPGRDDSEPGFVGTEPGCVGTKPGFAQIRF